MQEQQNPYRTCPRDGFPMLRIAGKWECVAEYLDRCIGQERVVDVVQRDVTYYYVFENGHALPLLCFCCGRPYPYESIAECSDLVLGRRLASMSIGTRALDDGREVPDLGMEFAEEESRRRRSTSEELSISLSVEVAAQLQHPLHCPYQHSTGSRRRRKRRRSWQPTVQAP